MSKQGQEHTKTDPVLDYALSVNVAEVIQAEPYHCWYNARDALQQLPGRFLFSTYTEGWLVLSKQQVIQVIEHGWIRQAHGRVVDPSIILVEKSLSELVYFPGLLVPWSEMHALQGVPLPLAHLFSPGNDLGHPDYRAAYDEALAYAERCASVSGRQVQLCPAQQITVACTKEGIIIVSE